MPLPIIDPTTIAVNAARPRPAFAPVGRRSTGGGTRVFDIVVLPTRLRAADFDPKIAFAAQPLPDGVNAYRSANGAPGPAYWQNRVDYTVAARIDTAARTLTATETVDYTNNSPDTLNELTLKLYPNIYKKGAIGLKNIVNRLKSVNATITFSHENEKWYHVEVIFPVIY